MRHVEFEGPASHVHKTWKFRAGAQKKVFPVPLVYRVVKVIRASEVQGEDRVTGSEGQGL